MTLKVKLKEIDLPIAVQHLNQWEDKESASKRSQDKLSTEAEQNSKAYKVEAEGDNESSYLILTVISRKTSSTMFANVQPQNKLTVSLSNPSKELRDWLEDQCGKTMPKPSHSRDNSISLDFVGNEASWPFQKELPVTKKQVVGPAASAGVTPAINAFGR